MKWPTLGLKQSSPGASIRAPSKSNFWSIRKGPFFLTETFLQLGLFNLTRLPRSTQLVPATLNGYNQGRVGGQLRCFWKPGWQLSLSSHRSSDLAQGVWQARGRAKNLSSECEIVDLEFPFLGNISIKPAYSLGSEGRQSMSSGESLP